MKTTFLLLSLLATTAPAATLDDLKATLRSLGGSQPIAGNLDIETWQEREEDDKPKVEQGSSTVRFEDSAAGLHLLFGTAELDRAAAEARGKDPEKPTPTRDALRAIDPVEVAELLSYAPALARQLDHAQLLSEKQTTFEGAPARQIDLKLSPPIPASQKKHIKSSTFTLRLWLGDDGAPLAAEESTSIKAKMLMMSFENRESQSFRFTRRGDRLVVLSRRSESSGSGFGQKFRSKTTHTVRIDR